MAVYDLEEQDQLEDLKAWWTQWGGYITAVGVAVCIGIVGVQGWRWWKHSQSEQASVLYGAIATAARANDLPKAKEALAGLTDHFATTGYAPGGAMIVAKLLYDSGDKAGAKAQLQWVIDRGNDDAQKQVARYRLATIQLDDGQYDDALRTLDAKTDDAFVGLYADLRGDVLAAAGKSTEARAAYQVAIAKFDPKSPYHQYVQVKQDALGGPMAPADAAAATAAAKAPPAGSAAPPATTTVPAQVAPPTPSPSVAPAAPAAPATPAPPAAPVKK